MIHDNQHELPMFSHGIPYSVRINVSKLSVKKSITALMAIDDSWVTTAAVLELVKLDDDSCVCKDESVVRGGCKGSEGCDLGGGNCN